MDHEKLGRCSFMGSDPFLVLRCRGNEAEIHEESGVVRLRGNPFDILGELPGLEQLDAPAERFQRLDEIVRRRFHVGDDGLGDGAVVQRVVGAQLPVVRLPCAGAAGSPSGKYLRATSEYLASPFRICSKVGISLSGV